MNRSRAALPAILALYLILAGLGIRWGLPFDVSWSNDDIAPQMPLEIESIYLEGTHKYPYLQALIDRALYTPYLARLQATAQLGGPVCPVRSAGCYTDPNTQIGNLILISRLRSLLMGLGIVLTVYALALRLFDDPLAARLAALGMALTETLIFYGKQGNLDVPHVFWFGLSLLAYMRIVDQGRKRDYAAFGFLSACALGTKDGIIGAYVLVGLAILAWHGWKKAMEVSVTESDKLRLARLRAGLLALPDARMICLALSLFGTYVLINGILVNPEGFQEHLSFWTGSSGIEAFSSDFPGPLEFARLAGHRIREGFGRPLMLLFGAGIVYALVRAPRRAVWLVLPIISYVLFTVIPIRFVYTRFVLPAALPTAALSGLLAAALWRREDAWRTPARALLVLVYGYSLLYSLNVDLAMRSDIRYDAEAFMQAELPLDAPVLAVGREHYLPRIQPLGFSEYENERWKDLVEAPELLGEAEVLVLAGKSFEDLRGEQAELRDEILSGRAGFENIWDRSPYSPMEGWLPGAWLEPRVSPRVVILRRLVTEAP
jgi:hypothetical protein